MACITKAELEQVIPHMEKRIELGDYFDLMRFLDADIKTITKQSIQELMIKGQKIVCVNGRYYLDEESYY